MSYGILELASSLGPAAAPADRAAGGQTSADQAGDGPDPDVTEMVHAPIQPRVRHEEGDDRAHADHGPAQPGPLDAGGHDGQRGVQRDAGADVAAGVARRRWGRVQMRNVRAWATEIGRRGDEDGRLEAYGHGRDDREPPASRAPPHHRDSDNAHADDDLGVAHV